MVSSSLTHSSLTSHTNATSSATTTSIGNSRPIAIKPIAPIAIDKANRRESGNMGNTTFEPSSPYSSSFLLSQSPYATTPNVSMNLREMDDESTEEEDNNNNNEQNKKSNKNGANDEEKGESEEEEMTLSRAETLPGSTTQTQDDVSAMNDSLTRSSGGRAESVSSQSTGLSSLLAKRPSGQKVDRSSIAMVALLFTRIKDIPGGRGDDGSINSNQGAMNTLRWIVNSGNNKTRSKSRTPSSRPGSAQMDPVV
jgi:hypothetical protein